VHIANGVVWEAVSPVRQELRRAREVLDVRGRDPPLHRRRPEEDRLRARGVVDEVVDRGEQTGRHGCQPGDGRPCAVRDVVTNGRIRFDLAPAAPSLRSVRVLRQKTKNTMTRRTVGASEVVLYEASVRVSI